jgi:hypothetical protein
MKTYTFVELGAYEYFENGKIEVKAKNKKEAVQELIKEASLVSFYNIAFFSKKVNELFTLI